MYVYIYIYVITSGLRAVRCRVMGFSRLQVCGLGLWYLRPWLKVEELGCGAKAF